MAFPSSTLTPFDGGGTVHADDLLALLQKHVQPSGFGRAFEWCSGPGFVGYALLAHNVCQSLCLADFYGPAVTAARHTARVNPPHFRNSNMSEFSCDNDPRIYVDEGWRVHRQFFSKVRSHLNRDGLIVLSENTWGSHLDTFRHMVESCGLVIAGWRWSLNHGQTLWYLFVTRDDSTVSYKFGT